MQMATSKVENSAQVLSCLLKFVHGLMFASKEEPDMRGAPQSGRLLAEHTKHKTN